MNRQIIDLIEQYKDKGHFTCVAPTPEMIEEAEEKLGFAIPGQFLDWLNSYSHGGIGFEVLGIGFDGTMAFLEETLEHREDGLPDNLPVEENCNEWLYCIDADTGEVISWYFVDELSVDYEIADAFGIDKETFLATVKRYNELYDAQVDYDHGKEPERLSAIRTAPFYACKLSGMVLATLGGIKINTKFQALDANNKPIEGLYVLGNDSGNFHDGTYPNLAAGLNCGRNTTFGMLCGKQLAAM